MPDRQQHQDFHNAIEACDDRILNPRGLPESFGRRQVLKGGLALSMMGLFTPLLTACQNRTGTQTSKLLGFASVAAQTSDNFDQVMVPAGYRAEPFFSWGDPVLPNAPIWRGDASEDWQAQLLQAGDNHDGMHFFPFAGDPDNHGLLVINHEYINPTLHPDGATEYPRADGSRQRTLQEVLKEQAAHGISIIELKRNDSGHWQRVLGDYNRRISSLTPMRLSGPLAGDPRMSTASDPGGRDVIGTLNNCAMGVTPWGTYLACEENFHNYFVNRDPNDHANRPEHQRYGIGNGASSRYYAWESVDPRFDATPQPEQPHQGHVNEPNRFGWVVEIDPFDPQSTPRKLTAMGRLGRECSVCSLADDGSMAFYSGDDARGEYVWKFIPEGRHDPDNPRASRALLDKGTLYAARFDADGRGQWLALIHGQGPLTAANGFPDQQAVLLNARGAADLLGATPMDRPEWVAVSPLNRDVYVSLTNNHQRGSTFALDAANPRPNNLHGQILRWSEDGGLPTALSFDWELFLLAGDAPGALDADGNPVAEELIGTIQGDSFSSPDGLAFDADGRLWIQTDADESARHTHNMGCNQLLCADPESREVRRFLVGPWGAEITGITWSPDYRTLWINVQHPGISYPASDGQSRPRSTTVMITRDDGGIIGA